MKILNYLTQLKNSNITIVIENIKYFFMMLKLN